MIHPVNLVHLVIWLVVVGLIFSAMWYMVNRLPVFEPFREIARVVLIVGAVLVAISFLLGLFGQPWYVDAPPGHPFYTRP
jgi:uncharacterized membrane protein